MDEPAFDESWGLRRRGWNIENEGIRESLFTVANGRWAVRGSWEGHRQGYGSYAGTYAAGLYNRARYELAKGPLTYESLVNLPNPLTVLLSIDDEDPLNFEKNPPSHYEERMDFRSGLLHRSFRIRSSDGRELEIQSERFASLSDHRLIAQRWTITARDDFPALDLFIGMDAAVVNDGIRKTSDLPYKHYEIASVERPSRDVLSVCGRLIDAGTEFHIDECLRFSREVKEDALLADKQDLIGRRIKLSLKKGETLRFERLIALCTSKDEAIYSTRILASDAFGNRSFDELLNQNRGYWKAYWKTSEFELRSDEDLRLSQRVRYNIFHLLQTLCPMPSQESSIPARGLHGEGYHGHIFWDEMFLYPFVVTRFPLLARHILIYRYNRLGAARELARELGCKGASFPWRSASDGTEVTPQFDRNPRTQEWIRDCTYLERHNNCAIAYMILLFQEVAGDSSFFNFYGLEMLVEICRFWVSYARYDEDKERYGIEAVMGPDEYHVRYPGNKQAGLDNNAYTNTMVAWTLLKTAGVLRKILSNRQRFGAERLSIDEAEVSLWEKVGSRIYIPFLAEGLFEQFEGYRNLKELDWEKYRARYGDIRRIDYILDEEGDSANNYKLSKQSDVLLLYYLLSERELSELLRKMGYSLGEDSLRKNLDYYLPRTCSGSTLTESVHSWVEEGYDGRGSWKNFLQAISVDIEHNASSSSTEGLHVGAMAGSLDLLLRRFTGLEFRDDCILLQPSLPKEIQKLMIPICYRQDWFELELNGKELLVRLEEAPRAPLRFRVEGKIITISERGVFTLVTLGKAKKGKKSEVDRVARQPEPRYTDESGKMA